MWYFLGARASVANLSTFLMSERLGQVTEISPALTSLVIQLGLRIRSGRVEAMIKAKRDGRRFVAFFK